MLIQSSHAIQSGFLLSRQVQDQRRAQSKEKTLQITLWLKTAKGAQKLVIDNELAVFFVEQQQVNQAEDILRQQGIALVKQQALTLKTFAQQPVHGFYFASLTQFYRARDCLKSSQIKCYEDDIRTDDRYLMERFITADVDFVVNNQVKCKKSAESLAIKLTMLSLDIECSMSGELYSIGLYANNYTEYKCVIMIGEPQIDAESYIVWVDDEKQLLVELLKQVAIIDADIFIGWNVINFDFRLLQKRMDFHQLLFAIGRDGSSPRWRTNSNNTEQQFIEIAGRVVLDGIDLLKTATYSFPSFSLDNVANTLLGIGKKVDDVDNRVAEITNNFLYDKPALAAYNLEDCRLVWLIFEKTQLLAFAQLRAQLTGLAIDRVGGSVAAFTNLYLPKLHRSGYVAPNMGDGVSELVSPGGYVMDSVPGLFNNVLVLDFKSLYPSIIRTFKIDPMGLIEGMKACNTDDHNHHIAGFDGAYFSREQHFLPDIITSLWLERDKAKLQHNAALSQAIKIIMNSFYGVLGSTGCRFFDPRLSGSITKRSHEILKTTKAWIEDEGYQVIYGDTDSIFVHVGADLSSSESKALGNELQALINIKWQEALATKFDLSCELEIEFETHFTKFLMPTIRGRDVGTKKRYAGLVVSDKTQQQKLIFKGLESVRTDWTQLAKDFQQSLYLKVFNNESVDEYIKTTVAKTLKGEFDDKLIYRKRIRRKLQDYVKNVPPHVKAARLADEANKKQGKPLRYQKRGWIEYYITINGPQAVEQLSAPLDYQFYIDRQLCAVADAILPFIGTSFEQIVDAQLGLF
ncbi:MAG: DNA polymerase II [Colwellia sp.]|nr:DNA polymerase II [Colwellia sp.]MCW8864457.1 DNA polymerase II [Colwellia sp.]MCW9081447.1 DNA polymerase II [Colwellia sp.]